MKKIALAIVLLLMLTPMAYADFITASPLGVGKLALGGNLTSTTYSTMSGINIYTLGGLLGYGLIENLDLLVPVGYQTYSGVPAGVTMSGFTYGIAAKYTFIKEDRAIPVSVAGVAGYTGYSTTTTIGGSSSTTTTSDIAGGVLVSKVIAPVIPYGGLAYHSQSTSGTTSTGIQVNAGVGIPIMPNLIGLVEYNYFSWTTSGATSTQSTYGLGVAWLM